MGQIVLCKTCVDALNRLTREVQDAHQRIVVKESLKDQKPFARTLYYYDAANHLVKELSSVMDNEVVLREYGFSRTYDNRGRKIAETELPSGKTTRYLYDKTGRLTHLEKADGVKLHFSYDELGRLKKKQSSDGTIHYTFEYDLHDNPIKIVDHVNSTYQARSYDVCDRLIQEELSLGVTIHYSYDKLGRLIKMMLPDNSSVIYQYDLYNLKRIERRSVNGLLIYAYDCSNYNMKGNLLNGTSPAGSNRFTYDLLGRLTHIETKAWQSELTQFDPIGNLLEIKQTDPQGTFVEKLEYDCLNHLISEQAVEKNHFKYDSLGNCLEKNTESQDINHLNQITRDRVAQYTYDDNGNLITQSNPKATYKYDALNRLTHYCLNDKEFHFIYDSFNRCLQLQDESGSKHLLYHKEREIGSVKNGQFNEFRLMHPHESKEITFAIELEGKPFFPIQDHRHNICALQRENGTFAQWSRYTAFGKKFLRGDSSFLNPWGFANRREVGGLSLFAHRFYNPSLGRWLTKDPIGFDDGLNLYAYVHNNPFYYSDPDGQFAIAVPIVVTLFEFTFGATMSAVFLPAIGATVAVALVTYGCYEIGNYVNNQNAEGEDEKKRPEDVYGPDRELPRDEKHKEPVPDTDAAHTQLGKRNGGKGKYTQAREFDSRGRPVRDIDFTDHGRPHDHTNPHQHKHENNPTGGTPKRGDPEPVPEWEY